MFLGHPQKFSFVPWRLCDYTSLSVTQDQATKRLAEILSRIKQLPAAQLEPGQFFANFLQLTVAATGSRGGAIWLTQTEQGPRCYCHIDLELCGIKESNRQMRLVTEAVQRTVGEQKPLVLPPAGAQSVVAESAAQEMPSETAPPDGQNQCSYPLFFYPLRAAGQVAMILQLIGSEQLTAHDYRAVVQLTGQAAETAEGYLAQRRTAILEDDRKSLARLLQYAEQVHGSLEPEKVLYQIANPGRDAIGCERVVVWIDPAVKRGLIAVSGVDKPDRRAVLLGVLGKLSRHCLGIKKPIVSSREQLVMLPEEEELTVLLKEYFDISQLNQIYLQPLGYEDEFLGVLIAEGFEEQGVANLTGIIATVAKHGALALKNALELASVPLVRPFGKLQKVKKDPRKRRQWTMVLAVIVVGLIAGLFIPWTIKIDCRCELTPRQKRIIDAPVDGVQITRILRPRGLVEAGEVIAELDDSELKAKLYMLEAQRAQEQVKLDQSVGGSAEKRFYELELERLQGETALVKLQIEKCKVRAPITGRLLTAQLEQREGMTVKKGDLICEIADLSEWELLLEAPQEEIAWVHRGLTKDKGDTLVQFYLASYPEHKLQAAISGPERISEKARLGEKGNIFEIRVPVPREELQTIMMGLGDGSEGRAKIATVRRPLGYVLLRKVIRFFRVTLF